MKKSLVVMLLVLCFPVLSAGESLQLTWRDNADNECGFFVERQQTGQAGWTRIAWLNPDTVNYVDNGRPVGVQQCYRLAAFNGVGNSDYSNTACGTPTRPDVLPPPVQVDKPLPVIAPCFSRTINP